jgi:hypothetical protein
MAGQPAKRSLRIAIGGVESVVGRFWAMLRQVIWAL